jgi:hypothetical protein
LLQNRLAGGIFDHEGFDGLAATEVFVEDALQGGRVNVMVFGGAGMDDQNRTAAADAQAVGDLAGDMLGVVRVVQTMLLDQPIKLRFQFPAKTRLGALAADTDHHSPALAGWWLEGIGHR